MILICYFYYEILHFNFALKEIFINKLIFFGTTVVNYLTDPKAGSQTLVGCPRPHIQYIRLFVTSRVDYLHPES